VGDEVFGDIRGLRCGSTCEQLLVNEEVISKKPPGLTHVQAAAIPLAAITAYQCLEKGLEMGQDNSGKSVFLTGGPGGVGLLRVR
jgi:NADPH:quinone reductase-like Zn-dependent oxidoreductase